MNFKVSDEVFEILPNICFGVVVVRDIDPKLSYFGLNDSVNELEVKYKGRKAKELEEIITYREAFKELGYNPNKFMPSIEALAGRVLKQKRLPSISPVVDLYNSISLEYLLPIGGHDMDFSDSDIELRLTDDKDSFIPFGSNEEEDVPKGELVYAVGNSVKTRRWIWRQGETGKITMESKNIFFPIDGFEGINDLKVKKASEELARKISQIFGGEVKIGYVNAAKRTMEI